jgi:predicted ArsR family transcriptional regulator
MVDRPTRLRHAPAPQALLLALRRDGPLSPEGLAGQFHISRTAALQQLRVLAAEGLVERRSMRHGVGRPRHLYDVTERAQPLLPASYDRLSVSLLGAVQEVGGSELLGRVFEARREAQGRAIRERFAARGLSEAPLADRARELATIQSEQGYVCEVREADGALHLVEHNCPIHEVAETAPAACDAEAQLFRDVLGVEIVRERHLASGERCCDYRLIADAGDPT